VEVQPLAAQQIAKRVVGNDQVPSSSFEMRRMLTLKS